MSSSSSVTSILAHGYRIVKGGKRGTKTWDIGAITARNFKDV
jgi:hypothetical protein